MKFILCGFSGAGKSSLLQRVKWGGLRIDLDAHVEGKVGKKIAEIMNEHGEEHFRDLEYDWLKANLERSEDLLVALGGGGLHEKTFELLKNNPQVVLIFIQSDFDECWQRIESDKNRPMTKLGKEEMRTKFSQRLKWFEKADIVLENGLNLDDLALKLENILYQKILQAPQ